jgi:uncharacterized protein (TIGR00255 family)
MIHSMTGFGRGQAAANGIAITAEAKSVNSRYLDISFRLPQELQQKELALKELIQDKIERGSINIRIRVDQANTGQPEIAINQKLARGYKELLNDLKEAAGIEAEITMQDLLRFDELFVSRQQDDEALATMWKLSKNAVEKALTQLVEMRANEGQQLENDLLKRVEHINNQMQTVRELTQGRAEKSRKELTERIQKLVDNEALDDGRLEMEVAILVDKMDITEEIVRVQSHIKYFKEALSGDETVGRRLKFLSQEMNREINTIGSKANNSEISQHVVQAKESLEQIREQVQNVE